MTAAVARAVRAKAAGAGAVAFLMEVTVVTAPKAVVTVVARRAGGLSWRGVAEATAGRWRRLLRWCGRRRRFHIDSSAITNLVGVSGVASPDGSPNGEIILLLSIFRQITFLYKLSLPARH